jgi:hypothetical protein
MSERHLFVTFVGSDVFAAKVCLLLDCYLEKIVKYEDFSYNSSSAP